MLTRVQEKVGIRQVLQASRLTSQSAAGIKLFTATETSSHGGLKVLVLFTNTARFQTIAQGAYSPPYLVRAGGYSRKPEWGLVLSRSL